MKTLSIIQASLFAHMTCIGVAVSAFSGTHLHRGVIPSSLNHCCKPDIHPLSPQSKSAQYNRLGRCRSKSIQASLCNDDLAVASDKSDFSTYYDYLLSHFQGDFDNYNQVVQDRQHGLLPGEGGGHENIHCTLVPCPRHVADDIIDGEDHQNQKQWVLAAFYFNGNPRKIFRFRAYQLIPPQQSDELQVVRMKLHTLLPHLEGKLRQCSEQPCTWWEEAWNVWSEHDGVHDSGNTNAETKEWGQFQTDGVPTMVSPLAGCDVLWDPKWDPSKHSYLFADEYDDSSHGEPSLKQTSESKKQSLSSSNESFHATMEAGSKGAIVDSISMIPGKRILIKDELSLFKDEFWINDRGYDPDVVLDEKESDEPNKVDSQGMPFVYGNQRGVPYKLQRVSKMGGANDIGNAGQAGSNDVIDPSPAIERVTANSDLEWTLGEEFRTEAEYQKKMQAIGIKLE